MIIIPQEIFNALLAATWSMENHDNSMSGRPTAEATLARDWLLDNCTWED